MKGKIIVVDGVEYRIGDRIPLTKAKLVVRPMPGRAATQSVRNVFTKGRT